MTTILETVRTRMRNDNNNINFLEHFFDSEENSTKILRPEQAETDLRMQKLLNAELLRVCQLQKKLLDEQSIMIEEILEGIGR